MDPIAYYKLTILAPYLKSRNKIKVGATTPRYDCTFFDGNYKGIKPFTNKKGMFYLNLQQTKEIIKADETRLAEFFLSGSGLNFTSMFFEDISEPNICYGYPNGKPQLYNGDINPMFNFRNDLYIIIVNKDFTEIEIVIFENAKAFASDFLQCVVDGELDDKLEMMRTNSKPFKEY